MSPEAASGQNVEDFNERYLEYRKSAFKKRELNLKREQTIPELDLQREQTIPELDLQREQNI